MPHQKRLWSSPLVRAKRLPPAERELGRSMEMDDDLPREPTKVECDEVVRELGIDVPKWAAEIRAMIKARQ
jgi:hypothetical protein